MQAEHIGSAAGPEQYPNSGLPEVALLGRSNVGKSSLLNSLVGKARLAFTSGTPGCTQVINFYRVEGTLVLVDLPGYGYARAPKDKVAEWRHFIEAYLRDRPNLALSVILLDARRGWMEPDLELKRWLEFNQRKYLVVATKVDKLNRKEEQRGLAAVRSQIPDGELVPFSAHTGRGVRELWQAISKTRSR